MLARFEARPRPFARTGVKIGRIYVDGGEPGQKFAVERVNPGEYRLVRQEPPKNEELVDWLLSCPEKGFFVPIDSESTDAL